MPEIPETGFALVEAVDLSLFLYGGFAIKKKKRRSIK